MANALQLYLTYSKLPTAQEHGWKGMDFPKKDMDFRRCAPVIAESLAGRSEFTAKSPFSIFLFLPCSAMVLC